MNTNFVFYLEQSMLCSSSSISTEQEYPQSNDRHPRYFSFTSMHATCLFMLLVGNLADSFMCSHPSVMDMSTMMTTMMMMMMMMMMTR
jgi:hypothetical protein